MCGPIQGAKVLCVCKLLGTASAADGACVAGCILDARHGPLHPNAIATPFLRFSQRSLAFTVVSAFPWMSDVFRFVYACREVQKETFYCQIVVAAVHKC